MTSSPRCRPLTFVLVSLLAWIVILTVALRFLFGADISGGWLIVAGVVTVALGGILLIVKEVNEAILIPACSAFQRWEYVPRELRRENIGSPVLAPWALERRAILGLAVGSAFPNRRRAKKGKGRFMHSNRSGTTRQPLSDHRLIWSMKPVLSL